MFSRSTLCSCLIVFLSLTAILGSAQASRLFEVQEGIPKTVEKQNSEDVLVVVPDRPEHLGGLVWIWSEEPEQPNFGLHAFYLSDPGLRTFLRTVDVGASVPTAAQIILSAAGKIDVFVNGQSAASDLASGEVHTIDITEALRAGANDIAIVVDNLGEPTIPTRRGQRTRAGLIGRIILEGDQAAGNIIPVDSSWQVHRGGKIDFSSMDTGDLDWERAAVVGPYGIEPWGQISGPLIPPPTFPRFHAPGSEREMELFRDIALRYFRYGSVPTYKDIWMPESYLWIGLTAPGEYKRNDALWKEALLHTHRHIDEDGYVATDQHAGLGHPRGWPFPTWFQSRGAGWSFSHEGNIFLKGRTLPLADMAEWKTHGIEVADRRDPEGVILRVTEPNAWLETPPVQINSRLAPFFTLEWDFSAAGDDFKPFLEWKTVEKPEFSPERRVPIEFDPKLRSKQYGLARLYDHPLYGDEITGFRIDLGNSKAGGEIALKLAYSTQDTRHNENNAQFIGGVHDVFAYTGDTDWLRAQMPRVRKALRFALDEFQVRELKHVRNPWIGHEGRAGIEYVNGEKVIHRDRGMGNNFWDLLPFGGNDFYASMLYFVALQRLANMEEFVRAHPEWGLSETDDAFDPADLRRLAHEMKEHANEYFWNEETGRFPANIDFDGVKWDYGFTFLNLEAIYYGFATDEHARQIMEWISGERFVDGDTSVREDIYHWRFAPRTTTKRNIEWYKSSWNVPERLNFGDQVQDGGAVFGFSYHDLMARHRTLGPDNAWQRLTEILEWYEEVWAAGGFLPYYEVHEGTLQSPVPGGLGLHREFTEPSLLPLYALKGLFGFQAYPDGFGLDPHFPQAVQDFRIDRVRFQDGLLMLSYRDGKVTVQLDEGSLAGLQLRLPEGEWEVTFGNNDNANDNTVGRPRKLKAGPNGIIVPLEIDGSNWLTLAGQSTRVQKLDANLKSKKQNL